MKNSIEGFGELVFGLPVMEARLSAPTFASIKKTIETGTELAPGEFCEVEISAADEYDLYATPSR